MEVGNRDSLVMKYKPLREKADQLITEKNKLDTVCFVYLMDDDSIAMQRLYDYGNLPPNPEAFLNREAFVQLVKEKLQLYQLNESQLAAVYENYTFPMNDDIGDFSSLISSVKTLIFFLLKSPSNPCPMASCNNMPGHPGPSTTICSPAGASIASSIISACFRAFLTSFFHLFSAKSSP